MPDEKNMPEQEPKIKTEAEPVKKESFSAETKKIISSTFAEAGEEFKREVAGKFEGKEGEEKKRKLQVLETASKIDIDKLSPQAKKLILHDLNLENKILDKYLEGEKDAVKKKELEDKINSLREARKELAGDITGEDPKEMAKKATEEAEMAKKALEKEIEENTNQINEKNEILKKIDWKKKRTTAEEADLNKIRGELQVLRAEKNNKEAVLKSTNVSTILEGKLQEIGKMSKEGLKAAEDEILKSGKRPERKIVASETEKTSQPVTVKQETPWAAFRDDKEFLGKWARVTEVSSGTKTTTDNFLKKEIEEVKFNFASEYAKKHKQELKDKFNCDTEKIGKKELVTWVDALIREQSQGKRDFEEEIKENSEYAGYNEKIDNLATLRGGWTAEGVRPNVAIGTLNRFQKRKDRLTEQVKERESELEEARKKLSGLRKENVNYAEMKKTYDTAARDVIDTQEELKSLSSAMKEITTATTGRDLTKEAYNANLTKMEDMAKKLETDSGKDSYMRSLGLSWEITPAVTKGSVDKLKEALGGQKKKTKEEMITLFDENSKEVGVYTNKQLEEFLFKKFRDKTTEEFIEGEVKEMATSPEGAKEGVMGLFRRMKKDLVKDFAKDGLKKETKEEDALKKIREMSRERGINCSEGMDATLERKTAYQGLTGDSEKDADTIISDSKKIWNVDITPEKFSEFVKDNPYTRELAEGNVSFFVYLMKLLLQSFSAPEKEK